MSKLNGIELKRARLVPSSMFASPDAVVRSTDLSRTQKLQILRRWEFDAQRTPSTDPILALGDTASMLKRVRGALAELGALPPVRRSVDTLRH
jgi:hypothetical protein